MRIVADGRRFLCIFPTTLDMDVMSGLIIDGVMFTRALIGLVTRPYETYRRIAMHGRPGELVYLGLLLSFYFALASLVRVASFRPFLLTQQFAVLALGAASGVALAALSIVGIGRLLGKRGSGMSVILSWSYTLVPTVVWFFATSVLYVVLPPPRTTSLPGILFSLLFLVFSASLLWWKITLSYLALRFSLRLTLYQAVIVAVCSAPGMAVWAYAMYTFGVFRVPFL